MAGTKNAKAAEAAQPTTTSSTGQAWAPAPGSPATTPDARPTTASGSDGLGIGSPIYEELVAELGDPAA